MAQPRARVLAVSLRLLDRVAAAVAVGQARVGSGGAGAGTGGAAGRASISSSSLLFRHDVGASATPAPTTLACLAARRAWHPATTSGASPLPATPTPTPTLQRTRAAFSSAADPETTSQSPPPSDPQQQQQQPQGVTLSDAAVARLLELQRKAAAEGGGAKQNHPPHPLALRVEVEGGGCSGFQYVLRLEEGPGAAEPKPGDAVFERDGARVLVDEVSLGFLRGAVVDYEDTLMRSAFHVASNPNSEASCGCGSSFAAKGV